MSTVEQEIQNSKLELWRVRPNKENVLDVILAHVLSNNGVKVQVSPLENGNGVYINVGSMDLYETLNNVVNTPNYAYLDCAFSGEDSRKFYNIKNITWDSEKKAQIEALFWRKFSNNLQTQRNETTAINSGEYKSLEVQQLGANAKVQQILAFNQTTELTLEDIQGMLVQMFEEKNQS